MLRAHALLVQFGHYSIRWKVYGGLTIYTMHYVPTACILNILATSQYNPSKQCVTVYPVPKFRSCHEAIMAITAGAKTKTKE